MQVENFEKKAPDKVGKCICELLEVSLGSYIPFYMFFWPAEFPGYHQWQQESQ